MHSIERRLHLHERLQALTYVRYMSMWARYLYLCVCIYIGLCVFFSSGYQIKRNESWCSDLAVPCSGTRTVTSLSPDCSDFSHNAARDKPDNIV